jgi:cytosine/adenosine deaminase-related metal-dependent hydrolase
MKTIPILAGCCLLLAPASGFSQDQTRETSVDLMIRNAQVVTMNAEKAIHANGVIAIKGSRIVAVGGADIANQYDAARTLDAGGDMVLPGMINTHTHVSMSVFRGLADDVADRLRRYIFPLEKSLVDREVVYWGALHGSIEMVEAGVTTYADMYYFEDEVARAAKEVGVRAILGESVIGFPSPDSEEAYGGLEYARDFIARFKNDPLVTPALAPHAPYTVDADHLRMVGQEAETLDVPVLIHLAETRDEIERIRKQADMTPVEYLDSLGLLNQRLLAAHCLFVTDSDIQLLEQRGVGVAHNMVANIKSAKGVAPGLKMFDRGVRIGLGTDGPMSGNTLDIIGQMGYVAKLHKLDNKDRTVMPPEKVVEMATIGGARALHMEDELGSLEPGKLADLIIIDKDSSNMIPLYDVYSALVYAASAKDVLTTIIHGRVVMENRKLKTVDPVSVKQKMNSIRDRIAAQAAEL